MTEKPGATVGRIGFAKNRMTLFVVRADGQTEVMEYAIARCTLWIVYHKLWLYFGKRSAESLGSGSPQ